MLQEIVNINYLVNYIDCRYTNWSFLSACQTRWKLKYAGTKRKDGDCREAFNRLEFSTGSRSKVGEEGGMIYCCPLPMRGVAPLGDRRGRRGSEYNGYVSHLGFRRRRDSAVDAAPQPASRQSASIRIGYSAEYRLCAVLSVFCS